jgi:anti-anti-sigma factor
MVEVTLLRVPVDVWQRASAHQEAVQREFDILTADLSADSVPRQLAELITSLDGRFGGVGDPTWAQLQEAAESGRTEIDLVFKVPMEVAPASRELETMLDRMDEYCRSGERLLTLATPDDLVAFRRWFLGEFSRQIEDKLPPTSWPGQVSPEEATVVTQGNGNQSAGTAPIVFAGDLDLVTAGALRDQILEARARGPAEIVLDLSGVTFIDSVGLSLLVTTHNRMVDDGVSLHVVLPARLRRYLEIAGLIEMLDPEFVEQEPSTTESGS